MSKCILVTGGAGYIGSHQSKFLLAKDQSVIVLDNLSQGRRDFIPEGAVFVEGNAGDKKLLEQLFKEYSISGVIHFAGSSCVGPSVTEPLTYYQNNVGVTAELLETMVNYDVKNLVFSSTAAVYGEPLETPISETHRLQPISPYGKTKWMIEKMLEDSSRAYGLNYVALRYFNAAGAFEDGTIGEDHQPESHLVPLVLRAAMEEKEIAIFGTDYDTPDGTCVRDYVHVLDLTEAHWLALKYLEGGGESTAINLGSGKGYSVKEVVEKASEVTGREIQTLLQERREGDVARLVADWKLAEKVLDWKPRRGLGEVISSAWKWESNR